MPHRRLTLQEASDYLHISPADIERLVREGAIPSEGRPPHLAFVRKDLDAWVSQRILGLSAPRLEKYHRETTARAHDLSVHRAIIGELTHRGAVEPKLESRTKPAVLKDMIDVGQRTGLIYDPAALLTTLQEREQLCSTGLADGLAILHPRHHEPFMFADSFIAVGRTVQGIPFGAPDGKPTDLFFLVCCQDDRIHLHVLARLCLMCLHRGLVSKLRQAPDANTMYSALLLAEQEIIKQA